MQNEYHQFKTLRAITFRPFCMLYSLCVVLSSSGHKCNFGVEQSCDDKRRLSSSSQWLEHPSKSKSKQNRWKAFFIHHDLHQYLHDLHQYLHDRLLWDSRRHLHGERLCGHVGRSTDSRTDHRGCNHRSNCGTRSTRFGSMLRISL